MLNRMLRAEKRARDGIVREAARQARAPYQPPRGVGTGQTTSVTSFVEAQTTEGPDGQTQWLFNPFIDNAYDENAIVPEGYPIIDYLD
jgi:hypothetical protein